MKIKTIKSKGEAIQTAIEYQQWQSNKNMSYSEVMKWQRYFEKIAKKFKLEEEFKENGVI